MDEGLIEKCDTKELETKLGKLAVTYAPKVSKGISIADRDYLAAKFETQGLSATALNNYLTCPWRYFYSNLVRIPTAISRHQMYGIAVHRAIKELFEGVKDGKEMGKKQLLANFSRAIKDQALSEMDYEMSVARGKKALAG